MKHEVELQGEEVPTQIIKEVLFTASPTLNRRINENAKARENYAQMLRAEKLRQEQLLARRDANTPLHHCDCSPSRFGMMRY